MKTLKSILILSIIHLSIGLSSSIAQETNCTNGIDDDLDGLVDCGDSDCLEMAACSDAFSCENTLYQVISNTLNELDPLTGTYNPLGSASSNFNGAGYNVEDGYIYGIRSASDGRRLWRVNTSGGETDMGLITNFAGLSYVGDFDDSGNLYTFTGGNQPSISYVDVSSNVIQSVTTTLQPKESSDGKLPTSADITYNPKFQVFLGLSNQQQLFALNHIESTYTIIGQFSNEVKETGSFGAAWSDKDGFSYFSNNKTGNIYRFTFDEDALVTQVDLVAQGQPTNSNDGMGCFFSLPPFETDCTDGIDNDGDGLTDCDDPDCAQTGDCPSIKLTVRSVDKVGPHSIMPFHLELYNNSSKDASSFTLEGILPQGFSFIEDTIMYSIGSSSNEEIRPIENDRNHLSWGYLNIPVGDTIHISFGLLVDYVVAEGDHTFDFSTVGVIQNPYLVQHTTTVDFSLMNEAETFDCEPAFYQVYQKKKEPNVFAKLNPDNGDYDEIAIIDYQANGLGFDIRTGYTYGADGNKFIRMDAEGNMIYMGVSFDKKVYVGDMDTLGYWYGKVGSDIVKIDAEANEIVQTFSGKGMPGWDMAYNKNGQFYAAHSDDLYVFNPENGTKTYVGELVGDPIPNSGHGAQWAGKDGRHYISNNKTGQIFRINVDTKEAILCMTATANLRYNDGYACPLELPAVFTYDYGDNSKMPVARQLVYDQDLNNDDKPDYRMVWAGTSISRETLDPSNSTATGDDYDDGLSMPSYLNKGEENIAQLTLSSDGPERQAYWGLWLDYDNDGLPEAFHTNSALIKGSETLDIAFDVPFDFIDGTYSARVRVTNQSLTFEDYQGDILEPGEVEDYILTSTAVELCENGIDDDNNGLIDCDDPACKSDCPDDPIESSGNGGLESNDRLDEKIATTLYNQKRHNSTLNIGRSLPMYSSSNLNTRSGESCSLRDLIPVDVIENTSTYITTPEHLTQITNATELFSVDVYENENRIAAILSLATEDAVYEHTKYICDRLTGSKILDIFEYKIDRENTFIIAKLELLNGNIEYSTSFSITKNQNNGWSLESHWSLEDYTKNVEFFNFQIWANNTGSLETLVNAILDRINKTSNIDEFKIGGAPKVWIKSGRITQEELILDIVNKADAKSLKADGYYSSTETTSSQSYSHETTLTGDVSESISLPIGDVHHMGLKFSAPTSPVSDEIFLANGTWGYAIENQLNSVDYYNVETSNIESPENSFPVSRDVKISGHVVDYITIYRSFNPRFTSIDLNQYNSISFNAKGSGTVEVAIVKESIANWADQPKMQFDLTEDDKEYILGKSFFKSSGIDPVSWDDANMLVFNVLGDNEEVKQFDLLLSDVFFGHADSDHSYVVTSSNNVLGPRQDRHQANKIDGTDMGTMDVSARTNVTDYPLTISNTGSEEIIVDALDLYSNSNSFSIEGFEPQVIKAGQSITVTVKYEAQTTVDEDSASVHIFIDNNEDYNELIINLLGSSQCIQQEYVSTKDIDSSNGGLYFAKSSITSDAQISSGINVKFDGGQQIELKAGFSISKGSEVSINIEDSCPTNDQ